MDLPNGLEDHVPVRAAEVGRRAQTSDGILLGIGVIDHDVGGIVGLDLGCEILQNELASDVYLLSLFLKRILTG